MSSGFVSGGTTDTPIERSDEWLAAQNEIEANRQRQAAEARRSDGRSLYETLEANKAAKQEAFEEANRLKNQFRSLDEDEIEFLDSLLESTRAEEARVKKETREGLEAFRRQQDEADMTRKESNGTTNTEDGSAIIEEEQWVAAGRKRKRAKDKEVLKGVKIRRSLPFEQPRDSEGAKEKPEELSASVPTLLLTEMPSEEPKIHVQNQQSESEDTAAKKIPSGGLGLVDYGSDDD
ncbi:hypothetical protein B7494_g3151 [Chlorociboria aeruginascens]|nr:hypothetical protein B7494_g3151 [Chlorociboria aeruginascens]